MRVQGNEWDVSPFLILRGNSAYLLKTDEPPLWDDGSDWMFRHEALIGIYADNITKDNPLVLKEGYYGEASLGWALDGVPRIDLRSRYYHHLISLPRFIASFRGRFMGDMLLGDSMPTSEYELFGGRDLTSGLGGQVRGFESGSYDAGLKAVANAELRASAIVLKKVALVPGVMAYFDAGYYGKGINPSVDPGMLASAGAAFTLDLFHIFVADLGIDVPLVGERLDGETWVIHADFDLF